MNQASKKKAAAVRGATPADDAPIRPDTMSRARRWTLIAIAVFCLLIFSVTGPMADTVMGWFGNRAPGIHATLDLPSGRAEITQADYQTALAMMSFEAGLMGRRPSGEYEDQLAYAALVKLAEEFEIATPEQEVADYFRGMFQSTAEYEQFYRSRGYSRAVDFENMFRRVLAVSRLQQLLYASTVVSEEQVLKAWHDRYDELRFGYAVWNPSEFLDAAAELTPTEEELQAFYDEGLTREQRSALEREQAAAFDLLVVDEAALAKPEVQALLGIDAEPTEAALAGFYNRYSFSLYRRPPPEEGQVRPEGEGEVFTIEELGDRLKRDYRLHSTLVQAGLSLPGAPDAAAFAAENGLRLETFAEPVKLSELEKLPTYGAIQLRNVLGGEPNVWMQSPVLLPDGIAYLMRPTLIQARELPPLAEIRDAVVGHWREKEARRLATEAAQAFVDSLPKPAEWVEGDPATLTAEAFAQALGAERRALTESDWMSRSPRPATDPLGTGAAETLQRRLRTSLAARLDDLVDGQVVGPEDHGADGIVVLHLAGRRPADPAQIWPYELQLARSDAQRTVEVNYRSEQLSFEGLAKSYGLTKVIEQRAE